ncbi:hypothetical protein [Arthrobacter luteolus]|uniref:hypothetical protein n=1 Tax=Arthrobacter luteolus TaxID=98672 RepID=UPI00384C3560
MKRIVDELLRAMYGAASPMIVAAPRGSVKTEDAGQSPGNPPELQVNPKGSGAGNPALALP